MTQFQSNIKKDINGNRTLFECNQFRVPKESLPIDDEPSESSVTRKRPIQQEETTTIARK
jgi:hypothetical protein